MSKVDLGALIIEMHNPKSWKEYMTDSKTSVPNDYFRTGSEAPPTDESSANKGFGRLDPERKYPVMDYPDIESQVRHLLPEHVVIDSKVAIDLGRDVMADGTPVNVVRTTTEVMMPKRMLSPGVSYAEQDTHHIEKTVTESHSRRIPHEARINMLNEENRANFDEVTVYMREDFRSQEHIRRVQETLLEKAGIAEHYTVKESVPPMEMYGQWFNPLTGERVANPNVVYRKYELVNNQFDYQYNQNLRDILATGEERTDRTGVRTLSKFGSIKHTIDLREGFPATTGKKFAFQTNKTETMDWMLKGKFDLKTLKDLGVRIWDQNVIPGTEVYEELSVEERVALLAPGQLESFKEFREELRQIKDLSSTEYEDAFHAKLNNWGVQEERLIGGDLGPIYGKQWRAWEDVRIVPIEEWSENFQKFQRMGFDLPEGYFEYDDRVNDRPIRTHAIIKREIDQVAQVEKAIAERSDSRRIVLTGWNVAQLDEMSLPPCHTMAQWYVSQQKDEEGRNFLDVELYQRSNDMFLGCPFNVAQYALITEMLAHVHGLRARMLYHTIGDAHIYLNHIEGPDSVTELLKRPIIHNSPKLVIAPGDYKSILDIPNSAVTMEGYESHPAFKNVPIAK